MRIIDTFFSFPKQPNIEGLSAYYDRYPDIFHYYFSYHCKYTEERLARAIEKYAVDWEEIKKVHHTIKPLVTDVARTFYENYHLEFPINVNLIVGAYGSNAYAMREIAADITFSIERLTYEKDPLKVIIAHEFGHVAHHMISDNHQMDWTQVQWDHPYVWLLQEGAATHFSKQITPDLRESIYFSYDYDGEAWLSFAKDNKEEIIRHFTNDIHAGKSSAEIFREWFSINGGSTFGLARLAYFVADCLFEDFASEIGEVNTLLLWKQEDFFQVMDNWLKNKAAR
ncbi:hypothetical protein [Virgibacillus kimchii]